jgi:hypothetical protein
MREISTFSVSGALRHSPSARCVTATNDIWKWQWRNPFIHSAQLHIDMNDGYATQHVPYKVTRR